MLRVADLVKGVNQCNLPVGLTVCAMWSLIITPAVAFSKLSQSAGTSSYACITRISSQRTAAVAKSASNTAIRKESFLIALILA